MNKLLSFLSVITLTACAQAPANDGVETVKMTIRPGEVRWIKFPLKGRDVRFNCKGIDLKFDVSGTEGQTVIVEDYYSKLEPFKCQVYAQGIVNYEINFKVEDREYKAERLNVPMRTIKPSAKDQKRAEREQLMLNKIYGSSLRKLQFKKPFIVPMNSFITSVYGTKRVYNNHKSSSHLGTDFRAGVGEKVPASNRGKVVFAGDLFYTGGTVIVDHGMDIFTVYGHLSQTLVKEGDIVERGQLIALSGNTGRSSGPHLHWGVKIQGDYIDGFVLIDETKKYFNE